nr:MAG TPA: Putative transferase, nesg, ydcK, Structural Genomics.38A [Caudoviricetes sp.]
MEKKFELTDNFVINALGIKLFQIKCTKAFKNANEGDLGGYVEKEENLSQSGDAWVYGDAWVSGNARVSGDARVENDHMHCGFDCFGSCNRHTHAYMTNENKVEIRCGCFRGSIEEFERKVKETHAGTIYEKQYKAIINLIKIKFGIDG